MMVKIGVNLNKSENVFVWRESFLFAVNLLIFGFVNAWKLGCLNLAKVLKCNTLAKFLDYVWCNLHFMYLIARENLKD